MMFDECPVEIFRRCARAAGLITRHEPLGTSLEAFGLMVALECVELAEQAAEARTPESAGQAIRGAFFGQSCGAVQVCPRSVPRLVDEAPAPMPEERAEPDGMHLSLPDGAVTLIAHPKA